MPFYYVLENKLKKLMCPLWLIPFVKANNDIELKENVHNQ